MDVSTSQHQNCTKWFAQREWPPEMSATSQSGGGHALGLGSRPCLHVAACNVDIRARSWGVCTFAHHPFEGVVISLKG